jgi:hypothetical protein
MAASLRQARSALNREMMSFSAERIVVDNGQRAAIMP